MTKEITQDMGSRSEILGHRSLVENSKTSTPRPAHSSHVQVGSGEAGSQLNPLRVAFLWLVGCVSVSSARLKRGTVIEVLSQSS